MLELGAYHGVAFAGFVMLEPFLISVNVRGVSPVVPTRAPIRRGPSCDRGREQDDRTANSSLRSARATSGAPGITTTSHFSAGGSIILLEVGPNLGPTS
jgi:hypothetical protein